MITQMELADPARGLSTLVKPRPGVAFQGLSVAPAVRAVVNDQVGQDGSLDTTAYLTEAAVALNVSFFDVPGVVGTRALIDEFGAYTNLGYRPVLTVTDDQWDTPRALVLRYDGHTDPVTTLNGLRRDAQYNFKAPAGCWQAAAGALAQVPAFTTAANAGLDWEAGKGIHWHAGRGLDWVAGGTTGEYLAVVEGNLSCPWQVRMFGPATGPKWAGDATGTTIEFTDAVVLPAGSHVLVDSATRSAYLNGNKDVSLLPDLIFATSDWTPLAPGANPMRYYPTSGGGNSAALVGWTPRWTA